MKKKWIIGLSLSALMSVSFSNSEPVDAATYVKGYFKKNGTYVSPHFRSDADSSFYNNYSTYGNVNPFTGERGTKLSPNESSSYNAYSNYFYSNTYYDDIEEVEDDEEYESVSTPNVSSSYYLVKYEPEEEYTKEEYNENKVFYEFKEATGDEYMLFDLSADQTIRNQSVDKDLPLAIEEFRLEVENHEVTGQYTYAREGLIEELGLIQSHIESPYVDYDELNAQIKSIKSNYRDVISVIDKIEGTE